MNFKRVKKVLNKSKDDNCKELSETIKKYENELDSLRSKLNKIESENEFLINYLIKEEKGYIFSVIMPIYNTENYLREALDSIINQDFSFDKIQIILVDDGSTDNSKKICNEYLKNYPNNIVYIYQENQGQSFARNNGLNYAQGKYLSFLDSDDKLELNTFKEVYYHFLKFGDEIDVISIPRYFFGVINTPGPYFERYNENRIVNIEYESNFPQVSISATFIKKHSLCENFDSRLVISEDSLLLNKTILNKGKFGVLGNVKYLYRKRDELNSTIDTKKIKKEYFSLRMKLYFKELINYSIEKYGYVPKYIQSVLIYDLRWLFEQKTEIGVLSEDEKNEYYAHIYDVLQYIDDEVIFSQGFNDSLKDQMINFKQGICKEI